MIESGRTLILIAVLLSGAWPSVSLHSSVEENCAPLYERSSQLPDLTRYVNPFIGTGGHGHTFPGPSLPFGMVQLSPDTRLTGWYSCSGYHYSDLLIYGFTH